MNSIKAKISAIKHHEGIMQINATFAEERLSALLLSADESYTIDEDIELLFKETEVMLATLESKVSARNFFVSPIVSIERGEILAQVAFDFHGVEINAIITKDALEDLGCKEGALFCWFVKSNEITLQRS